jgi:uncharacterized membrane protein
MQLRRTLSSIFVKGILTLLPIYLTFYFTLWLLQSIEASSSNLKPLFGRYYFPGMGIICAALLIMVVGWSMRSYITRYFTNKINQYLNQIPIIGEIYGSIQIMTKYFTTPVKTNAQNVVMVHLKESGFSVLGIVTRTDFAHAPAGSLTTKTSSQSISR